MNQLDNLVLVNYRNLRILNKFLDDLLTYGTLKNDKRD